MNPEALEAFKTFLYPETRDMLMAFLTLVTSVFSISMVFAEKFVGTQSSKIDRVILFLTWGLFFLAIVSGGWALHQLHIAGSYAYMPSDDERIVAVMFRNAILRGEIGGVLFGFGLLGLAFAAFRRVKSGLDVDSNP